MPNSSIDCCAFAWRSFAFEWQICRISFPNSRETVRFCAMAVSGGDTLINSFIAIRRHNAPAEEKPCLKSALKDRTAFLSLSDLPAPFTPSRAKTFPMLNRKVKLLDRKFFRKFFCQFICLNGNHFFIVSPFIVRFTRVRVILVAGRVPPSAELRRPCRRKWLRQSAPATPAADGNSLAGSP